MTQIFRSLWLVLAAAGAFFAAPAAAQDFPELTGRVVDAANVIPPDMEAALNSQLENLETGSQRQLVVATIPDLQGYEISDYGYRLGRAWALGDAQRNDGILLLVAPNEKKIRVEVGYGLEPVITDGLSYLIIQNQILPRFKAGDLPGGIAAGADALISQLQLPEDQARQIAAQANQQRSSQKGGFPVGVIIWIMIILFFVVLPMMRRRGRSRSFGSDAVGQIILWEALGHMAGSRGSGGFGGGGFGGGGGFSGGGGSFGGGGASGSW